jgi:hypothetical protein
MNPESLLLGIIPLLVIATTFLGVRRYNPRIFLFGNITTAIVALIAISSVLQNEYLAIHLGPPSKTITLQGPRLGPEGKILCNQKDYGFPKVYLIVFTGINPVGLYVYINEWRLLYDWVLGYILLLGGMIIVLEIHQFKLRSKNHW